jgi:hypothetical protein
MSDIKTTQLQRNFQAGDKIATENKAGFLLECLQKMKQIYEDNKSLALSINLVKEAVVYHLKENGFAVVMENVIDRKPTPDELKHFHNDKGFSSQRIKLEGPNLTVMIECYIKIYISNPKSMFFNIFVYIDE